MPPLTRIPETFAHFRILKSLGKGGMGSVYLAEDTKLNCRVALKLSHFHHDDDPSAVERFYREAKLAQRIHHPYVCQVFDVGESDGTHYLTMPYIDGTPLNELVGPHFRWKECTAVALIRRLALALQKLHDEHVIHRDLKPHNILIRATGEPVLMDFGLARDLSGSLETITASNVALGTPAYMPPELIQGDTKASGATTDVYSLGIILYQILTGHLPFRAPNITSLFYQIINTSPHPATSVRPDLDEQLDSICRQMIAKDPKSRFTTMEAFVSALDAFTAGTVDDVMIKGHWYSQTNGFPSGKWKRQCPTPGRIQHKLGSVHQFFATEKITDTQIHELAALRASKALVDLHLFWCNEITDVGFAALSALRKIEKLNLCNANKITDRGLIFVKSLHNLKSLRFAGECGITKAGLKYVLRTLPRLERLSFAAWKNVANELPSLQKGFPHCEIKYEPEITFQ